MAVVSSMRMQFQRYLAG